MFNTCNLQKKTPFPPLFPRGNFPFHTKRKPIPRRLVQNGVPGLEVYNVRISHLPIDINGGVALFGVSAVLGVFRESGVRLSEKVSESVVFARLHHRELEGLPKGVQNVFQITQVRTQS